MAASADPGPGGPPPAGPAHLAPVMVAVALVWIAVVAVAGADGTSLTGYIPGLLLLTSLISALHARSERRAPDRS